MSIFKKIDLATLDHENRPDFHGLIEDKAGTKYLFSGGEFPHESRFIVFDSDQVRIIEEMVAEQLRQPDLPGRIPDKDIDDMIQNLEYCRSETSQQITINDMDLSLHTILSLKAAGFTAAEIIALKQDGLI